MCLLCTISVFDWEENIVQKGENSDHKHFLLFPRFSTAACFSVVNPLSDMPILGSLNSAASKDMMSKIWTNGDTII